MNILLLAPKFHNYYVQISNSIEKLGHKVFYYPDEIPFSFFDRIKRKFSKKFIVKRMNNYIKSICNDLKEVQIDKIIVIFAGRYFSANNFNVLKKQFCNAETIYYAWDSIDNFKNITYFYKMFDRTYSFDLNDCEKYELEFLPLFFIPKNINENVKKYDYSCVMTYGYPKAFNYKIIKNSLPKDLNGFEYLFIPHRSTYLFNRLIHGNDFKRVKKYMHFKPLSISKSYEIFSESKVVIDCPMQGQSGLTIRTFEALSQNIKLITTNTSIKKYDFYNENNIFVVENQKKIPISFFDTRFDKSSCLGEKYSIDYFVKILLGKI